MVLVDAPILYSCHFGGGQFTRLAKVLEWTAAKHCGNWDRRIEMIGAHTLRASHEAYADNTHKLDRWNAVVQALPEAAQCLLVDADTFIMQPLDAVWHHSFDIAYTVRPANFRFPLNAGVVFVRSNERSKAFMADWADVNRRMVGNREFHQKWRRKYGGMNQAAFGCVLASKRGVSISTLPCHEWNCEDSAWGDFSERTRIVHVKSLLRRAVFNLSPNTATVRPIVKVWRGLEREAMALPA